MQLRHLSFILMSLLFALSLIIFITSVKYAEWAATSMKAVRSALPIIFYSGTIPVFSLIETTLGIACLHLSSFLTSTFLLTLAATGSIVWLLQVSIWASCELSGGLPAPGKRINIPQWCPQFAFTDRGANLSAALTIFKNTLAWVMLVAYLGMAVVAILSLRQVEEGTRSDEFHELAEMQPLTPRRETTQPLTLQPEKVRPYSTTYRLIGADNAPAIQILPISTQP